MKSSLQNLFEPKQTIVIHSKDLTRRSSLLRKRALENGARQTQFGSMSIVTETRSRRAQNTQIIRGKPDRATFGLLRKVQAYLESHQMFDLIRTIAPTTDEWRTNCRLLVSAQHPHLPLYWGNMLSEPGKKESRGFELLTVSIPEWQEQKILVFPDHNTTILLGTDYVGEHKMSFLRLMMHKAFSKKALGCHAASKIFRIHNKEGSTDKGAILFGLSKTGKTTLTTHTHDLSPPERIFIPQDDIVIFTHEARAIGTEQNFYVTSEGLSKESHPTIWEAATTPNALLENVCLNEEGFPDFDNIEITANGRVIIQRKDLAYASDSPLDAERIDFVFFITRRNDIIDPMVRLSPEWAALTFLLGESVQTAAGDPSRSGQSLRVPGFDPFMLEDPALVTNHFYELLSANPHIQCILLNTGMVGQREKIYPTESARMIEMAVRNYATWKNHPFWGRGYDPAELIPQVGLLRISPEKHYPESYFLQKQERLLRERQEYLEQFRERLYPEIARLLF